MIESLRRRYESLIATKDGLRLSVAAIGGVFSIVIGLIHLVSYMAADGLPFHEALFQHSSGTVLVLGVLWGASTVLPRGLGQSLQVAGFAISGTLGALTGESGNLNGVLFFTFAILLSWEYAERRIFKWGVVIASAATLTVASMVNLWGRVPDPVSFTVTTLLANGVVLAMLGAFASHKSASLKQQNGLLDERIKARTEELEALVQEREVIIQEVHHRVKNNLQMIISMLNIQEGVAADPGVYEAIARLRDRIYSVALVHQTLYQGESLNKLNLSEYVRTLVDYVRAAAMADVTIRYTMNDDLAVSLDTAVSLGVVINELVTNVVKHAFPGDEKGKVEIGIDRGDESILIKIRDNGVGYAGEHLLIDDLPLTSGMGIAKALVEHIDGKLYIDKDSGTIATIEVPIE